MSNRRSRFWQELKRRKVIQVITVYAGAAFVIIELINNITEPLHLPEWTPTLVIILLLVGFPLAVIFSWIFDISPEGGIVKTEPAHEAREENKSRSSNNWKIASYISFGVIVALIVLNIFQRTNAGKVSAHLDKSIAVLPFINDSPEETEMYFINGTMESILDNLCKIRDLRVVSRTSVEQYRNNPVPIPAIAKDMNVSYVVEGSGLKQGDNIRLTIQLIDAVHDVHLWSRTYNRKTSEIFELQSEIAQLVAEEIEAVITPEEKERIEKIPTSSLKAYDYYQRGQEAFLERTLSGTNQDAITNAEEFYKKALEYDSTFAPAYIGLVKVYAARNYLREYFSENFFDSVLILSDKALSFDPQLSEAYSARGNINYIDGEYEDAIAMYDIALRFNPNDWMAYRGKYFIYSANDMVKAMENIQKAIDLNREPGLLPLLINHLGGAYCEAGFHDIGYKYFKKVLNKNGDSVGYYNSLMTQEYFKADFEESLEYAKMAYALDSTNVTTLEYLGDNYEALGDKEEALCYYLKFLDRLNELDRITISNMHRIAYAFWLNGREEEAEHYFDLQVDYCEQAINLGRPYAIDKYTYYDLAGIYAFRGNTEKALENLRIFNQREIQGFLIASLIRFDPLLDNIRSEPEFQKILGDVEAKYQAEHERVRQWLEKNDML